MRNAAEMGLFALTGKFVAAELYTLFNLFYCIRIGGNIVFQFDIAGDGPFVFLHQTKNLAYRGFALAKRLVSVGRRCFGAGFVFDVNAGNAVVQSLNQLIGMFPGGAEVVAGIEVQHDVGSVLQYFVETEVGIAGLAVIMENDIKFMLLGKRLHPFGRCLGDLHSNASGTQSAAYVEGVVNLGIAPAAFAQFQNIDFDPFLFEQVANLLEFVHRNGAAPCADFRTIPGNPRILLNGTSH